MPDIKKRRKEALARLRKVDPNLTVRWDDRTGVPRRIRGSLSPARGAGPAEAAAEFLREHRVLFGIDDPERELEVRSATRAADGRTHVRLDQTVDGVRVFQAQLVVHVGQDNSVAGVNGTFHPDLDVDRGEMIEPDEAAAIAHKHAGGGTPIPGREPRLRIYVRDGKGILCWWVVFDGDDPDEKRPAQWVYFVEARKGAVVYRYNNLQTHTEALGWGRGRHCGCVRLNTTHDHTASTYELRDTTRADVEIRTYDNAGGSNRDNLTISTDPDNRWNDTNRVPRTNSQEPEADVHHYAGIVVDYYASVHGRSSYDDAGGDVEVVAHHRHPIYTTSAFWDPARERLFFPDCDGTVLAYKSSLDVVAHEFTHGVIQFSADLTYAGESGALNESIADFMACMVQRDWAFEEEVYLAAGALRSLRDPTLFGQPDHFSNYAGVLHDDSGIPNKAGYLMTHGGTHSDIEVFGLGREVTERIWYHALVTYLVPASDFDDFRDALEDSCADLFPGDAWVRASVLKALAAVGIGDDVAYPNCPGIVIDPPCVSKDVCSVRVEVCGRSDFAVPVCRNARHDLLPEPCALKLEPFPCALRLEPIPCTTLRTEGVPCVHGDVPGCTFRGEGTGGCCSRELILEPDPSCRAGDIPWIDPVGCTREIVVLGRLTERGTVEVIRSGRDPGALRHARILTRKGPGACTEC